jgi:hypothetical protein
LLKIKIYDTSFSPYRSTETAGSQNIEAAPEFNFTVSQSFTSFPQKGDYGYAESEQETSYKKQGSYRRPVRSMARFDRAFLRGDKSSYIAE